MNIRTKEKIVRVLIIEDEVLFREYLCDYLEDCGYISYKAENGKVGLDTLRTGAVDVILTDLRMPGISGLDVLSTVQKEFPHIPVIVISGNGSLRDAVQSLKLGAWDYLLKPLHDYTMLESSIKKVMNRKRLIDEKVVYREHLEDVVVKRSTELMNSKRKFETLFNMAGDAVIIHDRNGVISDINLQAVIYSGYSRDELLKMNIRQLFHEQSLKTFNEYIHSIASGSSVLYEAVHVNKKGETIPVEINASEVILGDTCLILSLCRNISERKKGEEEKTLLEQQCIASQKMETLGLLASGIAHDFNNILTALNGYVMLLKTQCVNGSEESEYVVKINNIIQMGHKLTRRITTFVRKDREELQEVDVHDIISETVAILHPNCSHSIHIKVRMDAKKTIVIGDEIQLENALINLGINARDAIVTEGNIIISTENADVVKCENTYPAIVVTVADTGTGMTDEVLERIFDPLFTTKERGKGTGLGLTSVMYCVKNHHGEIEVESVPGSGTKFRIILPLVM